MLQVLDQSQEAAAENVILSLPPVSADKALGVLDRYDPLIERYR